MDAARVLGRPATMADLEALPANVKGEIIDGTLYVHPRPRALHSNIEGAIHADVFNAYQRRRGGPGGWWILVEPGIQLDGSPEFSPDVAGWKRERMPKLPDNKASIRVVPTWVCEVFSPSTRGYDQLIKKPFYARIGVEYLWYVDPGAKTLTASRLVDGHWVELGVYGEDSRVRIEPFPEAELDLGELWTSDQLDDE